MSNILKAIINIESNPVGKLKAAHSGRNSINNIGEDLEAYIQNAFANTISETDPATRDSKVRSVFSYLGNQNNPPDIILRNSDAIEVKKIQSKGSAIALNSSYPKHKLYASDSKITNACRNCENWEEKDIIYAVGVTNDTELIHLWLVYGDCYAASKDVYERISRTIKKGVTEIPDVEFSETKELGRVNRVDSLGITNLRIRGMWHIDNPLKVFKDTFSANDSSKFALTCILREEKFNTFDADDKDAITNHPNISLRDIKIKNPDNTAKLINAKLITMELS